MKPPKIKLTVAVMPKDNAIKAGEAALAKFAHHPPSPVGAPHAKMERPKGGHGPKN
jgi:hypothetical protein